MRNGEGEVEEEAGEWRGFMRATARIAQTKRERIYTCETYRAKRSEHIQYRVTHTHNTHVCNKPGMSFTTAAVNIST
jgi:hypothetical protein